MFAEKSGSEKGIGMGTSWDIGIETWTEKARAGKIRDECMKGASDRLQVFFGFWTVSCATSQRAPETVRFRFFGGRRDLRANDGKYRRGQKRIARFAGCAIVALMARPPRKKSGLGGSHFKQLIPWTRRSRTKCATERVPRRVSCESFVLVAEPTFFYHGLSYSGIFFDHRPAGGVKRFRTGKSRWEKGVHRRPAFFFHFSHITRFKLMLSNSSRGR